MTDNLYRQKLINSILYFARETSHLNLTKLFKLLNFFDFEHFAETGYPAIGLKYVTWKRGPVPRQLWHDLKDGQPPTDIGKFVATTVKYREYDKDSHEVEINTRPGAKPNMDVFTPREQHLLEKLAYIYKDATAKQMSEISHEDEKPWRLTMDEYGENAEIDYMLAHKEDSPISEDEARQSLNEHWAAISALELDPMDMD